MTAPKPQPLHQPHFISTERGLAGSPAGLPPLLTPADNPLTEDKVVLGRWLFFDRRLSWNGTQSCSSCHDPARAFTDGRTTALGSTGQHHFRNSGTLVNVAWRQPLTWASRRAATLEAQVAIPLTNEHPVEMGMRGHLDELIARLRGDDDYRALFAKAFAADVEPLSIENVYRAIASYERTIVFVDSPFDRFIRGNAKAFSSSAWRGLKLFNSERMQCSACHGGMNLATPRDGQFFQNNNYWRRGNDIGLARESHRRADRGLFRVPTLRNLTVTGPYMHDGGLATLSEVIDFYAGGGGIRPFAITPAEKTDLLAFLESLTDERFKDAAW